MGLFSKKVESKDLKAFESSLAEVNMLAERFRKIHLEALSSFDDNFSKTKSERNLASERKIFERHLDVLEKLKDECDGLVDEAFHLVRNETLLTEKDRVELRKILHSKSSPTSIKVASRSKSSKK